MSDGEYQIEDTTGRFTMAVKDGQRIDDLSWLEGRILLSNERLILAGGDGKLTINLNEITGLSGREGSSQSIASLSNYLSIRLDGDVIVVSATDHKEFTRSFYKAVLDEAMVKMKHPAVEGGVVQDSSWENARLSVEKDALVGSLESGDLVELDLDEISDISREKRTVSGQKRTVIEISHAEGTTSVETHLTGGRQACIFAQSFLETGERRSEADVELEPGEEEVLMALYSGVSPFEIPDFVGKDVEEVEEIFDRLVELDIVDRVRMRQEVVLNSRGRNIAGDAMSDQ